MGIEKLFELSWVRINEGTGNVLTLPHPLFAPSYFVGHRFCFFFCFSCLCCFTCCGGRGSSTFRSFNCHQFHFFQTEFLSALQQIAPIVKQGQMGGHGLLTCVVSCILVVEDEKTGDFFWIKWSVAAWVWQLRPFFLRNIYGSGICCSDGTSEPVRSIKTSN